MFIDKKIVEQRIKNDFILSGKVNFESFVNEEIQFYMNEFMVSYFWMVQLVLKILKDEEQVSVIFEPELLKLG